ncbi:hypothetical protein EI94DRAFT_1751956 [Lactarius quietus]|nr:hypothetical protein EI94DRAFT_1751956 [Lactarius quietus]
MFITLGGFLRVVAEKAVQLVLLLSKSHCDLCAGLITSLPYRSITLVSARPSSFAMTFLEAISRLIY